MKKVLLIFIASFCCVLVSSAQDVLTEDEAVQEAVMQDNAPVRPDIYADMSDNVTFHQDSSVTRLLSDLVEGAERETVQIQGYRVQVFSSNRQQSAKNEAFELEKRIQDAQLQTPVYVLYVPPFWKVRLGDFRTKEEAVMMKDEVLLRMPELQGETYVVRDKITVTK